MSGLSEFASDLLHGADEIAEFLFGNPSLRRKVYHLAKHSRLPIFRLGSGLCARRSVLYQWVVEQERRGWTVRHTSSADEQKNNHDKRGAEATDVNDDKGSDA